MCEFWHTITPKKCANLLKNRASYVFSCLVRRPVLWGMPVAISVEPIAACQLHCPECVLGSGNLLRHKKQLPFDIYKKIIEECSETLIWLNLYFQGEPFLSPQIFEMIKLAKQHNVFTCISTNAQSIDKTTAEKIVESKLDKLIISLDGVTQQNYEKYRIGGNIDKVFSAIDEINKAKLKYSSIFPKIELQFIVFKHNESELEEFLHLAKKLDVEKATIKSAQIYNYAENSQLIPENKKYSRYIRKNGEWILRKKLRNRCLRLWQSGVVTTDGNFLPCCFDKNAEFSFGNLGKNLVFDIWRSDKAFEFRKQILSNRKNIRICQNCSE